MYDYRIFRSSIFAYLPQQPIVVVVAALLWKKTEDGAVVGYCCRGDPSKLLVVFIRKLTASCDFGVTKHIPKVRNTFASPVVIAKCIGYDVQQAFYRISTEDAH
jgi:hypothetical protein